ncbi:MAG: PrsW family intramembrane metalloprotease [Leptospira sp.]|nr:PrsW family intramembrane metalloprotease [Leptospira sp.]
MLENEIFLLAIAILPGLIYVSIYYNLDKHRKEPIGIILKAFFWGAAVVLPIGILQTFIPEDGFADNFLLQLTYMVLVVGFTEEFGKWLVTRFYSFRKSNFDELTDGLVYGASAGGGFAVFENIFYVMENGFETAVLRSVLSVPGHIFWGSISGFWLAKFKFQGIGVLPMLSYGLGVAIVSHGLFNTFLSFDYTIVLAPVVVLYCGWLTKKYFKEALEHDLENIHSVKTIETVTDVYLEKPQKSIHYQTKSIAVSTNHPTLKILLMQFLGFFAFLFFVFGSLLIVYMVENQDFKSDLFQIFIEDGIAILVVEIIACILYFYYYKIRKDIEFNHKELINIQKSKPLRIMFYVFSIFFGILTLFFCYFTFFEDGGEEEIASSVFIIAYLAFFSSYFFRLANKNSSNEVRAQNGRVL